MLLRVQDDKGVRRFDWRRQPIFTEATFSRFDPASTEPGPFEEKNVRYYRARRRVEDWWNNRRPTEAPLHPKASLHPKAPLRLPDELKHENKGWAHFLTGSEFATLRPSEIILNPTLDILCLQVGDLSDPSPLNLEDKDVVPLSSDHPDAVRISNLAIEFHGATTREWCRCCRSRLDGAGYSIGDFVHDPDACHKELLQARRCTRPCAARCDDCVRFRKETTNHHDGIFDLLDNFPAARSLFLIDWAYEPVGTNPDPSTAYASNGDYDFFPVEKAAGQERWRAERPCPFESLYCAESIEDGLKWDLARRERNVKAGIGHVNRDLASMKNWSFWDEVRLHWRKLHEENLRFYTLRLDETLRRVEQGSRCQVLAAVKKKKSLAEEDTTESVVGGQRLGHKEVTGWQRT
ncbi:hypothetical protein V2G26_014126 [Clonostachys chloroleuca]